MSSPTVRISILSALALGIVLPSAVSAQALTDFCPEADAATEAAVIGIVSDPESGMALPGAEVVVSWLDDGTRQRIEVPTGIDGVYMACGLPQGLDMQVRAMFGDRRGEWVDFSTETILQQHDLALSLSGEQREEDFVITEESRRSSAFSGTVITYADLGSLPEMTLYQLLRQHQRLRFERGQEGEFIIFAGRGIDGNTNLSGTVGRYRGVDVFINERREGDPISALRDMWIHDVLQIDIMSAGEASARYGGDGWLGAISVSTRRR